MKQQYVMLGVIFLTEEMHLVYLTTR